MGKIVYIMGKSSSGKDTIYRELLKDKAFKFKTIVLYTTRPMRGNETEGVEYHFTDEAGFKELEKKGLVIESRVYHTIHGDWYYFTVNDGNIDLSDGDYAVIGTLESYISTKDYFGEDKVVPVLIELDDGIRLKRALEREMNHENRKFEEMCRRFLADNKDFSEENIKKADIKIRFENDELSECLGKIKAYLKEQL